jgi:ubiquinone/menaquinone biosynthesis C-methylase UbiE
MDWDEFAKRYDDLFLKDPIYREILWRMVEEVGTGEGIRVMDLGCGTGNLISMLLERYPDVTVTGIDPSKEMREICSGRFNGLPQVSISEGDALNIPFPEDSFDVITSSLALHHIPLDLKGACAAELARVLAPGGSFVHADTFCAIPGSPGNPAWYRDIIEKFVDMALYDLDNGLYEMMIAELRSLPKVLEGDGEYPITVDEWEGILEEAGFDAFKVMDMPPIDLLKILRCTRR